MSRFFQGGEYLGDGVYARPHDVPGGVILATTTRAVITNLIVLEPEVYDALVEYVTRLRREQQG